jgi:hypothetical protein
MVSLRDLAPPGRAWLHEAGPVKPQRATHGFPPRPGTARSGLAPPSGPGKASEGNPWFPSETSFPSTCSSPRIFAPLAARVMSGVQLFQALARDVRVDLRRRDVGMSEKQLHHPQVGAVIDEMRRERVAQGVR